MTIIYCSYSNKAWSISNMDNQSYISNNDAMNKNAVSARMLNDKCVSDNALRRCDGIMVQDALPAEGMLTEFALDRILKAPRKYKYETHLHTKEASACGGNTGAEMVRAHYRAGYSGMIVTDHFFNGNTAIPAHLSWPERVELFCLGYESALREAEKLDFHVFFGWEYADNGAEFLTYGLGKDFLLSHPDMLSWPIEQYLKTVRAHGAFVSQAHPYREAWYIKQIRVFPEQVDAIEIRNASHTDPKFDQLALELANKHMLYKTGGSDTHFADRMLGGGMEFDHELKSIEDFIQAVKSGTGSILP
jgi:hypothetical protein